MRKFDLIVIGSGTAAGAVVSRCTKAGWSVAVVDSEPYGGTCALRGCDPKKMLRRGPEVLDAASRMTAHGIVPEGLRLDWSALQAHKRSFTDPVPKKRETGFREMGATTLHGVARFTGRQTLDVSGEAVQAERIVIAAGMKPRPLGIPGAELAIDSTDFLELEALPRRILFIGGGYVSFEFAHMAARAGAEVTVLNRGPRLLKAFDPDLVDRLVDRSREIGLVILTEAEVKAIRPADETMLVRAFVAGEETEFGADLVVHGAGRAAALDELDVEAAGISVGKDGVEVNAYLRSVSNPMVYAAGDAAATAGPPLTPVAALEGKVVAANLLKGDHATADYAGVPSAVFTLPPLTRVGPLEAEVREAGLDVETRFTDMSTFFTSRRVREPAAAAKVLVERGTDRVVGAHLLGPEAVELANLLALAIRSGLDAGALRNFVSAYPSGGSDLTSLV